MLPLTISTPKVLLPLAGRPFLDHQLEWLQSQGVSTVILCLGHLADQVEAHLRTSGWHDRMTIYISNEDDQRLGTAGAVRLAISKGLLAGPFLTLYGDCLPLADLPRAVHVWTQSGRAALLAVYPVASGAEGANAAVREGMVVQFIREPSQEQREGLSHADYGLAGFNSHHFTHLEVGERAGFASIHCRLAENGQLKAFEVASSLREIGSLAGYRELQASLSNTQS